MLLAMKSVVYPVMLQNAGMTGNDAVQSTLFMPGRILGLVVS